MPPTHTDEGLRAAIAMRREIPAPRVLVFSQYVETKYAARLLAGSAAGVGYLLKDGSPTSPTSSTRSSGSPAGGRRSTPRSSASCSGQPPATALAALTARERDVLALMAEGRSNSGIAAGSC